MNSLKDKLHTANQGEGSQNDIIGRVGLFEEDMSQMEGGVLESILQSWNRMCRDTRRRRRRSPEESIGNE